MNPLEIQLVTLLGNGDGTFQSPVLSPAAIENQRFPSSIAVGDFNADGRIDLAVTFFNSGVGGGPGDVEVFLGNGDGTLQSPIVYPLSNFGSSHPDGMAIGDFNRDGKLDLIVSDNLNALAILLGNGDGSFQTPTTFSTAGGQLATADLNGDGKADLIVIGPTSASVFLGNGDGTFAAAMNFPIPSTFAAQPILADLNGDGKLDLVVSIDLGISILPGNGDGTFRRTLIFRFPWERLNWPLPILIRMENSTSQLARVSCCRRPYNQPRSRSILAIKMSAPPARRSPHS